MISMVKIASAEAAWRYYQETVPGDDRMIGQAVDYYTTGGTPPGRWIGSGVSGFGIREGDRVASSQLSNLYGRGTHPSTGDVLTRSYVAVLFLDERVETRIRESGLDITDPDHEVVLNQILVEETARAPKSSVAGFEMVFTTPKLVSVLWGLAPESVKAQIKAAHDQATVEAITLTVRDALRTRIGVNGVAQVGTLGMIATAFDHWDSRESDPHLHTHVLIANRVQGVDGKWRTIDSRYAFRPYTVTASEAYDRFLQDALSNRLGVEWTEIQAVKHPEKYAGFSKKKHLTDSGDGTAVWLGDSL